MSEESLAKSVRRTGLSGNPLLQNGFGDSAGFDRFGECRVVQHIALGLHHMREDVADFAGALVLAVGAAAVGDLAEAGQRGNGTIDQTEHLAEGQFFRRPQQDVTAEPSAAARDDPSGSRGGSGAFPRPAKPDPRGPVEAREARMRT